MLHTSVVYCNTTLRTLAERCATERTLCNKERRKQKKVMRCIIQKQVNTDADVDINRHADVEVVVNMSMDMDVDTSVDGTGC